MPLRDLAQARQQAFLAPFLNPVPYGMGLGGREHCIFL